MTELYDTYSVDGGGPPLESAPRLGTRPLSMRVVNSFLVVSFEVPKTHPQGWPNLLGAPGYNIGPSKTGVAYTTRNKAGAYI